MVEARPLGIPEELLALPADATVSFERSFGSRLHCGAYRAGDYLDDLRVMIKRQAEGFFTTDEAAQVIGDSRSDVDSREIARRFKAAILAGKLPIHQAAGRFVRAVGERAQLSRDLLRVSELDAWLRDSTGYGFPQQKSDWARPAVPRPMQRQPAQEAAILAKLSELGFDAQALPAVSPGRKSTAKQDVRLALDYSDEVMEHAWKRLSKKKKIRYA